MPHDDAAIARELDARAPAGWREPGFVRPLAGYLLYVSALLAVLGPYLYLTSFVVPSRVQPYPAADGAAGTVDEVLLLGWALGDLGLTAAIVRAVAALRRRDPARVVPHLRLLVRWQLGACALLGVGCALASRLVPESAPLLRRALHLRAATAPLLALSALPAICEALQRYDRQLLLELLDKRLLQVLLPIPCVLVARRLLVGLDDTARALTGLVAGQAAAAVAAGAIGLHLVRRTGLPLGALLRGPLPSSGERGALYRFGAGIMAGKAVFFVAGAAELSLLVAMLPDYATQLGYRQILLGRLLLPLWLLWPFCESAMPTLVDALSSGRPALARATFARYLQHGHLFVGTLFALVVGGAPPLVRALLPPAWHAAAALLPLAGLVGLLLPLTWLADAAQRAHGDSGRNAAYLLAEQALRLGLLVALLPRLGLAGLFASSAIATALKTAAVLADVHLRRMAIALPIPAILVGPLGGALAVAIAARALVTLGGLTPAPAIGLPVAFALAAVLAFPLALFCAGLAGGLEPSARAELRAAAALAALPGPLRRAAAFVVGAGELGARLGWPRTDSSAARAAVSERTTAGTEPSGLV